MQAQFRSTWNPSSPVPATGGYKVYRKLDGAAPVSLGTMPSNITETTDSVSLSVGTHTYQFGVAGTNSVGDSAIAWGPVLNVTIVDPVPSVPTGVDTQQV